MSNTQQLEAVPFDAMITIEISGAYFARLQQLTLHFSKTKAPDEFAKIVEELKTREPKDEFEYHFITLLSLNHEIEVKAREQKKTVMKDVSDELSKVD